MGSSLTLSTGFSWLKIKNNLEQLFKGDVVVECRESWCQIAKSLASFFLISNWTLLLYTHTVRVLVAWLDLKKEGGIQKLYSQDAEQCTVCAVFTHMIVVAHARCCWANMLNGSFYIQHSAVHCSPAVAAWLYCDRRMPAACISRQSLATGPLLVYNNSKNISD